MVGIINHIIYASDLRASLLPMSESDNGFLKKYIDKIRRLRHRSLYSLNTCTRINSKSPSAHQGL